MYDRAIQINPNYANSDINKGKKFRFIISGIALSDLGKLKEAISMYDHAIEINRNDASAYHNKGKDLDLFFRNCAMHFRKI